MAECMVLPGLFGLLVQGLLFLCCVMILVYKKVREGADRTWLEFGLDSSKQLIGAGCLHVLNLVCAEWMSPLQGGDECEWYWINIMVIDIKTTNFPQTQYGGRTPVEERQRLEAAEAEATKEKVKQVGNKNWPPVPTEDQSRKLLVDMVYGRLKAYDPTKAGGNSVLPLATAGLAPTNRADFALVSTPTSYPQWGSHIIFLCARYGIGLASTSTEHWGDVWYWLWRHNLERMQQAGKRLLVLTGQDGGASFTQAIEICYLREQGAEFTSMKIRTFLEQMQPLRMAVVDDDDVEALLNKPVAPGAPPLSDTENSAGITALHTAALACRPVTTMFALRDFGLEINAQEFVTGGTPLHGAAQDDNVDQIEALLVMRADLNIKNEFGDTPLKTARYWKRKKAVRILRKAVKERRKAGLETDREDTSTSTISNSTMASEVSTAGYCAV